MREFLLKNCSTTVERPPNKGHLGISHFVLLCWEVVPFSEAKKCTTAMMGKGSRRVSFVGRSSLSQRVLLSEVPLYVYPLKGRGTVLHTTIPPNGTNNSTNQRGSVFESTVASAFNTKTSEEFLLNLALKLSIQSHLPRLLSNPWELEYITIYTHDCILMALWALAWEHNLCIGTLLAGSSTTLFTIVLATQERWQGDYTERTLWQDTERSRQTAIKALSHECK